MKTIVFTGGGSGGHTIPAIALIKKLQKSKEKFNIVYIGSKNGIERTLIKELNIPYSPIYTGKLRRYFSFQNLSDIFKITIGLFQSYFLLKKHKTSKTLIFSTGGFVSVPVVISGKLLKITTYIHEQTSQVGLANKIASRFASKIFISFQTSKKFFPPQKTIFSGYPLRQKVYTSIPKKCIVNEHDIKKIKKPILFITGGGNGSGLINDLIFSNINSLCKKYFVIHLVGQTFIKIAKSYKNKNYTPLAFLDDKIIDVMKLADICIARAGAGTVSEMIELNKKVVFIPLKIAQKNEQYYNAVEASKKILATIITEEELNSDYFLKELNKLSRKKTKKEKRKLKPIKLRPLIFLTDEINNYFK